MFPLLNASRDERSASTSQRSAGRGCCRHLPSGRRGYVDGTFGRGGHSRGLLARLGPAGRLIALDRDLTAIAAGQAIDDARFTLVHARFAELASVLDDLGVTAIDGVLLDIGVSSPQLDEAARGMSFRQDAPLDMRMDTSRGETVAQWLARADEADIKEVIRDYGEERFASAIAKAIVAARGERPVDTTYQLAQIVASAVRTREAGQHPATRSFQALRIFINKELEELSLVLPSGARSPETRRPVGGDLLPFAGRPHRQALHGRSGQSAAAAGACQCARQICRLPGPCWLARRSGPTAAEVQANPRARSAVMRVMEKC
jgi:16S rRNA (cytosine1402-N4)-methyltransferase